MPSLEHMKENSAVVICPACGGNLAINEDTITCLLCGRCYQVDGGVPLLFCSCADSSPKEDITETMRAFYEKVPFPNYEGFEDTSTLIRRAREGIFSQLLDEQLPFNIRILEVGCGTGQFSNFLGIANRFVFGTDISINSLRLAEGFKERHGLKRVGFYQMNLFKPIFKPETFHVVLCIGVLHHTSNPFEGFKSIAKLVKKDGYIIIGVYNRFGRIAADIRRLIFRASRNRMMFLDPQLKRMNAGSIKAQAWYRDQYENPKESKHTVGEILRWFDETNFDFISSIPKLKDTASFSQNENLFKQASRGNRLDRLFAQAHLMLKGNRNQGLFIMIGKRK